MSNPIRFSSKYQDSETDLFYYGFRYYSASMGRWISRDPVEETGGWNLSVAFANCAVSFIDRLGRHVFSLTPGGANSPSMNFPQPQFEGPEIGDHFNDHSGPDIGNQTPWFEQHYPGWTSNAIEQARALAAAVVNSSCASGYRRRSIIVGYRQQVIPYWSFGGAAFRPNPGSNESLYGDSTQSFFDARSRLGNFSYELFSVTVTWAGSRFRWCGTLKLRDDLGTSPGDFGSELVRAFFNITFGARDNEGVVRGSWLICGDGDCCK